MQSAISVTIFSSEARTRHGKLDKQYELNEANVQILYNVEKQ